MLLKLRLIFGLLWFIQAQMLNAQTLVEGTVVDAQSLLPIPKVKLYLGMENNPQYTDAKGRFSLRIPRDSIIIYFQHPGYVNRRFLLVPNASILDLGPIVMYTREAVFDPDQELPKTQGLSPLAQYVQRYTSGMPFRLGGRVQTPLIFEGLQINDLLDGHGLYQQWSGLYSLLNEANAKPSVVPSAQFTLNTSPNEGQLKSRLGTNYNEINGQVGFKIPLRSGTWHNRIQFSRRWSSTGYFPATLVDSYSAGLSTEYTVNTTHAIKATAIYSYSRQGEHTSLTDRVYQTMGAVYNPLWGMQQSLQRNSRISKRCLPLFYISYKYHPKPWKIVTQFMVQGGENSQSRLAYQNAENPFPDHWAKQGIISESPQIDWYNLYVINQQEGALEQGAARYLLLADVRRRKALTARLYLERPFGTSLTWNLGLSASKLKDHNYAIPTDLLGAAYYRDVNEFWLINGLPAENELGNSIKSLGEKSNYFYTRQANELKVQQRLKLTTRNFGLNLSSEVAYKSFFRTGHFKSQTFPEIAYGNSKKLQFTPFNLGAILSLKLATNHTLTIGVDWSKNAPAFKHSYINPRAHNLALNPIKMEEDLSIRTSYQANFANKQLYISGYFSQIKDGVHTASFFADGGIGSHFFNVITSGIQRQHLGIEASLHYPFGKYLSSQVVMAIGQFTYAQNAQVQVNYNTTDLENDHLRPVLLTNLGTSYLKNYQLANGPSQLYGVGLRYARRSFAIQTATNLYREHYMQISGLRRTSTFYINPQSFGQPFEQINQAHARQLLQQQKISPTVLTDVRISKWWKIKTWGLGLSININNLFNRSYITSASEQHRLASYPALSEDVALGDQRNFGPKFQWGQGRTFYLQASVKF